MRFSFITFILVFILIGVCYAEERDSFGTKSLESNQEFCYALGNIGFDAVKNADAGIPMSEAMRLAVTEEGLSPIIAVTVKDAYSWEHSPHEFAMRVYASCMKVFDDTVKL